MAILTGDDAEDLSSLFNVYGVCLSFCVSYPLQKSAVKLYNGKTTEVCRVYVVYSVQLRSVMVLLGCFVAETRCITLPREGDNVVVAREQCNQFGPSCMSIEL